MRRIIIALVFSISLTEITIAQKQPNSINDQMMNNPFFKASTLQYQAPDFTQIKDEHFKPAFDFGLNQQIAEIETIISNPSQPTFENTIIPLEKSGIILKRAQIVFYNLTSANTNATLQALEETYAPLFAAHSDKLFLNSKLYNRIKAIDANSLDLESKALYQYYLTNFEMAGAALSVEQKQELKKINEELATLSSVFDKKLLDARKNGALHITDVADLEGLSQEDINAAAALAKKSEKTGYLLGLLNTTQQPLLQNLEKREIREKLYKSAWTRAERGDENDTRETLERIAKLRLKKAQLLGKENFAQWKLQDQMAKDPAKAIELLETIAGYATKRAKEEAQEIQALIKKEGKTFKLEPWDWNYYAEKVRKLKYNLDDNELKPYFEVNNVLEKGVFVAAEKFYGITFKKRPDLPVYHPDVVAYEVFDRDGKSMAIYYLDFFTRDNKRGGAWMSNFVEQSHLLNQKPVIVNVFNYQKPAHGNPSLINFDEVSTLFHEFGHTLHGLFANQKYLSLSGTNVARDFVEFPSQINEHFALESSILKNYALHYQTQEPMPEALVAKIKKSTSFNQGYATLETITAAMLDMSWHTVKKESDFQPTLIFEEQALATGITLNEVPPRYHTPYFAHIWGGGYAAGYYAYAWSETLDNDAWDWIKNNGGMTRENGDKFRAEVLSVGNTIDLNQAFKNFTGRTPDIKPLLRNRGFIK